MKKLIALLMVLFIVSSFVFAGTIEEADMFFKYGLYDKAKESYISVILTGKDADKADAYYKLGSIVYAENDLELALDTWKTLMEKYPKSSYASMVTDRISVLAEVVGESTSKAIDNAVASSYLKNGDFWSSGKSSRYTIDSSWIDNVDAAIKWYDKVIKEFPKSDAAEQAYVAKIKTILGWKESGTYGSSYGIKANYSKYLPILLETFEAFKKDFPESSSLQPIRYQIAQVYWNKKDWANTRKWLNEIITVAGSNDSFYKDLAERRLLKVEY